MATRLFDIVASLIALIVLSPVLIFVTLGIWITDGLPVFYRAKRIGLGGHSFTMHKFRTMRINHGALQSAITSANDSRVFLFGSLLRKSKIDELPQLIDVLRGKMAVVGPRPEDADIVAQHYGEIGHETLLVKPGLASPGSIFNYTHGEKMLDDANPESSYIKNLLPIKLELDCVYVRHRSFLYDISIIFRTVWVIISIVFGRKEFSLPPEYKFISKG
ncbi:MAG: sugar transferase [Deltaproteobacteria bacterium]|jgi:lipopolysaccharide/colanic/teichoic acid biosynthesis glycosyltransferase|nr:sugar transferase [Deltaproteobacteria bacterium]